MDGLWVGRRLLVNQSWMNGLWINDEYGESSMDQ
jgi:hypothetical protein